MTDKTVTLTPEQQARIARDANAAAPAVHKTHASAKPGEPNISEDDRLKNAGSPFKDINRGNRSSMDE